MLPLDWVSANVTPIFKKGDKQLPSNYRPISLTCIICKILEKFIHRKLYALLESNNVLSNSQYGFRTNRSTTTLLLTTIHDWAEALNNRLSTHCVLIDFAKAFDSVPHGRLLLKLQALGVHGSLLQWFRSFLTTRRQRVVVNGHFSDWSAVSSGVPQGSILGPLLFIIYVNDISSVVRSNIQMFADDLTLYRVVSSFEDCKQLQKDLDSVLNWCDRWQMNLQPQKCELLCISNKRLPLKFDYALGDFQLCWRTSIRYLGVCINSTLSWNDHCSKIAAKSTRVFNFLRHNLYGCTKHSKYKCFRAFVLPILEYACQAWSPHTQKCIKQLESIQYRGARWICGARFNSSNFTWTPSSSQCCTILKWPSLADRCNFRIIQTVHDILHKRSCIEFGRYFTVSSTCTRSHSLSLFCKQASVNSFRYSFFINSIFIWNCVPYSILSIHDRISFRSQLCSFLFCK